MSQTPVAQILRQTTALLGIVFARKSPERLSYSRRNLIVSVFVALFAAYFAHTRFLGLDTPHALVKLVFELGILVVGLNFAWRSRADRQRLLRMTMTLFLISAAGDVVLILLSLVPLESIFSWPVSAGNCLRHHACHDRRCGECSAVRAECELADWRCVRTRLRRIESAFL